MIITYISLIQPIVALELLISQNRYSGSDDDLVWGRNSKIKIAETIHISFQNFLVDSEKLLCFNTKHLEFYNYATTILNYIKF